MRWLAALKARVARRAPAFPPEPYPGIPSRQELRALTETLRALAISRADNPWLKVRWLRGVCYEHARREGRPGPLAAEVAYRVADATHLTVELSGG